MREWMITAAVGLTIAWILWGRHHMFTGRAAPDFTLSTVDGATATLANEKGKVVVLDFWATWCPPCQESLPHLQDASLNSSWADRGLVVWAVNCQEPSDRVESFLDGHHYSFTTLLDGDGTVMSDYGVSGIPMTVIIGRDGRVADTFTGYGEGSAPMIDSAIEKALAQAQ
jgi:peroxiredoxin